MCGVAFISGYSSVQFGVLFVGNGLAPFVAAIFAGNFHSNVAEPAVGLGTVPVLDVGRDGDHGAGGQADGRFAFFLVPAFACGANQQLAAALGRVVDMPVVAAAGLKGNVGQKQASFGVGQRVQERLANEKLGISGVCGTGAKTFCCSNSCLSMHFILVVSCFSVSLPCCA